MATREQLESALRKAHAAGDTYAAQRFADAIRAEGQAESPQAAMTKHMGSLEMQMALAGAEHQKPSLGQYAKQSLKEMAIPAITTAAGSTLGLPGAMIGAATGELMNQAMGISGGSVIPEANVDKTRIALAGLSPAILPAVIGTGRALKSGGQWIGKTLSEAVEPLSVAGRANILSRYRGKLMNNDPHVADRILQAVEGAKILVPGSKPTVAEAVSGIPSATGLAAYEKKISKMEGLSGLFQERTAAQEAARSQAIGGIAKTPADLNRALKSRAQVADVLYNQAFPTVVERDATFKALMERPSMQAVTRRAKDLALESGDTFKIGQDLPERIVESPLLSASGHKITTTLPAEVSKLPVKSLHYMKMAMDDLIKDPERFGIGAAEAGAIAKTQKSFVEWLGQQSPEYHLARETYRQMSSEPNRMQVGQYLQRSLDSPLESVAGLTIPQSERAAILAKAVQDAPKTIKNATGQTMFDTLDEVLAPTEVRTVNQVVKDLARHQAAKKLADQTSLPGSDAIPGSVGLHLPPMLSRTSMLANWALGKLGQDAESRIAQVAAKEHLDLPAFAGAIQNLPGTLWRQQLGAIPTRTQLLIDAMLQRQAPYAAIAGTQVRQQQEANP